MINLLRSPDIRGGIESLRGVETMNKVNKGPKRGSTIKSSMVNNDRVSNPKPQGGNRSCSSFQRPRFSSV